MSDKKINKQNQTVDSNKGYTAPEYKRTAFHCPHCGVYSNQKGCRISEYDPDILAAGMYNYIKMNNVYSDLHDTAISSILDQIKKDIS